MVKANSRSTCSVYNHGRYGRICSSKHIKNEPDFQNYLSTFIGTDYSAYSVKKSIGKEFTEKIFETFGKDTFIKLETNPPNTRELKDPQLYLNRIK